MSKNLIISYYVLLIIFVMFQALQTVLGLSQNIGYGNKLASLEKQKQDLTVQQTNLQTKLCQNLSLTSLANNPTIQLEFKTISQIISIDSKQTLASR